MRNKKHRPKKKKSTRMWRRAVWLKNFNQFIEEEYARRVELSHQQLFNKAVYGHEDGPHPLLYPKTLTHERLMEPYYRLKGIPPRRMGRYYSLMMMPLVKNNNSLIRMDIS